MDVIKRQVEAVQRFGMPDEQVSARLQPCCKPANDVLLGSAIEVDHHVPAQDQWKGPDMSKRIHEIEPLELDCCAHFIPYPIKLRAVLVTTQQKCAEFLGRNIRKALPCVDSFSCNGQHPARDIGSENLQFRQRLAS